MSERPTSFTAQRARGERRRRTSAETAAAFLESFQKRGGQWSQDRKSKRLRTIRRRAKPQIEVAAQRRAMEAGETPSPPLRMLTGSIRDVLGPVLSDILGLRPSAADRDGAPAGHNPGHSPPGAGS